MITALIVPSRPFSILGTAIPRRIPWAGTRETRVHGLHRLACETRPASPRQDDRHPGYNLRPDTAHSWKLVREQKFVCTSVVAAARSPASTPNSVGRNRGAIRRVGID